jgi:hypothetical protein
MFPLDKWHKGNPFVWLWFYFLAVLIFVIIAVILSPLNIGANLYPVILTILIYIGAFFLFVVIVIALVVFFSSPRHATNYQQYNAYKYTTQQLIVKLRTICRFAKINQFPLICKKIINAIKFRHQSDE